MAEPVLQRRFADHEVSGDLLDGDAALTATSDRDNVLAELLGVRTGRDDILPVSASRTNYQFSPIRSSRPFDLTEMMASQQAFDYGSQEWEDFHEHARNTVESGNIQLKASGDEDIETSGRRRVRGFSAAQIMVTLLLVNHNIRKIASFIDDLRKRTAKSAPAEPAPLGRRDRVWANRYTKTTGATAISPSLAEAEGRGRHRPSQAEATTPSCTR